MIEKVYRSSRPELLPYNRRCRGQVKEWSQSQPDIELEEKKGIWAAPVLRK
jgi:hypothetical protein